MHEHASGRHKNAGTNDGANNNCAAIQQAHFGLEADIAIPVATARRIRIPICGRVLSRRWLFIQCFVFHGVGIFT